MCKELRSLVWYKFVVNTYVNDHVTEYDFKRFTRVSVDQNGRYKRDLVV